MKGDDILSVIFLALVCIVISGIVVNITDSSLMIPSFVFIAICLWVAYDYMLLKRHKTKHVVSKKKPIAQMVEEIETAEDQEPEQQAQPEDPQNEYDLENIPQKHAKLGCSGDNQMCNRMKYQGMQAKASQDARARFNRYNLQPLFDEELRENENRDWWSDYEVLEAGF